MQAAIQLCQPLLSSSILPIAGIGHRRIFENWEFWGNKEDSYLNECQWQPLDSAGMVIIVGMKNQTSWQHNITISAIICIFSVIKNVALHILAYNVT